jgi:hypothetical protein
MLPVKKQIRGFANHHPEPLTENQQAEFNRNLRAAEGEMS